MNSVTLDAHAKINLYLDVLGKRRDGYHNISTLFQKIGLCDRIRVAVAKKGISLHSKCLHIPNSRSNIAYKAARLMLEEFGLKSGIDISITKRIPVAAGLGGGSSDAACVMMAIKRLFRLKIPYKKLISLASEIGADVPFFVSGYNCAIGRGIGDRLQQVDHRRLFHILLLIPRVRIYTKTIYRKISLPLTKQTTNVNMIARILSDSRSGAKIAKSLFNRLEDIVLPIYPVVREGKALLSLYAEKAIVSGSGPTIFALFNDRKEAMGAKKRLRRDERWQLFLTKTV